MRLLAFLLLASSGASKPDATLPDQVDCKAERIALLKSVKPLVDPDASLESKEDNDPNTIEFFFVKALPAEQSHVSEDGQAIYISDEASAEDLGARLFAAAVDRLLESKIGKVCPPIQISQ
jgi:hypothetical protein